MYFNTSAFLHTNTIIGRSCHKYHFCHDKRFVMTNMCLSRQICVCRNKHVFVATKYVFCRDRSFVATKVCLSRQNFCRNKHVSLATKIFCRDKHNFVATKLLSCLSRQKNIQYNITLLPSVNTLIARGMFCGAKYTNHTFTPIIKHLITTTANKKIYKKNT